MDSSLYKVISSGEIDQLKQKIASSSDVGKLLHQRTPLKNTTLHVAVKYNKISCVEEICIRCPSLLTQANMKGDTPLHIASRLGLYNIASFFIQQAKILRKTDTESYGERKEVEVVEEDQQSELHKELRQQQQQQVQQLVRMTSIENDTALHEAVKNHHFEVVKLLTEADPYFEYLPNNAGETPLYLAAEDGLLPYVVRIIQTRKYSGHDQGLHGRTPLHIAVISNSTDAITKFLVESDPGIVKEEDEYGSNALHYAAYYGDIEKVVRLLEGDRSVACMPDKDGKTPLHVAASTTSEYRIEVIKELTRCRPECWELQDNEGCNFVHAAAENGVSDVIKYVLDLKKSMMEDHLINEPDNNGNTPLHLACLFRNVQAVGILSRDSRVNKCTKNKDSLTALDLLHDNLVNDDDNVFIVDAYNILKKSGGVRSYRKRSIKEELDKRKEKIKEELDKRKKSIKEEIDKQKERRIKEELDKRNRRAKHFEEMEKERQTRLLVATLIATVTFAAGFTLPGGYFQDGPHKGMAILTRKPAFIVFLASNTIAMLLSTFTLFIHFWFRQGFSAEEDDKLSVLCMSMEYHCTFGAIIAMVVAFVTGAFSVLFHPPGLAIPICVLGCSFFLLCGFLLYESYILRGIVVFGYLYRPGKDRVKN